MKNNLQALLKTIHGRLSNAEKFHNISKNKQLKIIQNPDNYPTSWTEIHFKTYPRLKSFTINTNPKRKSILTKIINKRTSTRNFSGKEISFETFFHLLKDSAGINRLGNNINESKRTYPSAGARYPLELYAFALHVQGLKKGLYHFNVKHNLIECLLEKEPFPDVLEIFGGETYLKNAAVIFLITGVLGRTQIKYGDRGYRFMLIESGHLAQNICLLATEAELSVCTYGGFIEDKIAKILDITLQKELPIYSVAIGSKSYK